MKNKMLFLSTIICLLPMSLSVMLYSRLPEEIAVHFNTAGTADQYLPKAIVAFGLPIFFAIINLYSHFRVTKDPKRENIYHGLKLFTKWLIPIISVILIPVTLFIALGENIPIHLLSQLLIGLVIAICGNYLPKCKRNYTIGIKLPWTLDSEENWNKTHRFTGFLWVICGICMIFNAFFNIKISWIITISLISILVILPFVYSYLLYQEQERKTQ